MHAKRIVGTHSVGIIAESGLISDVVLRRGFTDAARPRTSSCVAFSKFENQDSPPRRVRGLSICLVHVVQGIAKEQDLEVECVSSVMESPMNNLPPFLSGRSTLNMV